ncbi:MAG: ferredoxin, partial [Oscillospiraceae bacterium]|nr:ferredoxin [Oscillospiraceae bacterium]
CMKDIGILASLDPVAIDQACIDLIYSSDDPGRDHFVERVESRNGIHTIEAAAELGFGSREYELIEV